MLESSLITLQALTTSTLFSLIMLQPLRTATLLKRDSSTSFFCEFCELFKTACFVLRMYQRLVVKHQCAFLRTAFFTEPLQWMLLTVSGFQPAALLKNGLQQTRFSVNFAKFLRTSFYRTPSDDYFLCLPVILRSFSDHLFYKAPLGNSLFHVQVGEFQPPDKIK